MGASRNNQRDRKGQSNRRINITRKKKAYFDPYNRAKLKVNRKYAQWTREHLGTSARHLILDSEFCVTSKFLVNEGFARENIIAPNMNRSECDALESYGVCAPNMTIEQYAQTRLDPIVRVDSTVDISTVDISTVDISTDSTYNTDSTYTPTDAPRVSALWYDSMTNLGGNVISDHYAGIVLDRFLRHNRATEGIVGAVSTDGAVNTDRACTIAVTLSTRSNQPDSIHGDCVSTVLEQVQRLCALRGFAITKHHHTIYKKNMLYAVWNLKYEPNVTSSASSVSLLKWKNQSKRYIGFPPGYEL